MPLSNKDAQYDLKYNRILDPIRSIVDRATPEYVPDLVYSQYIGISTPWPNVTLVSERQQFFGFFLGRWNSVPVEESTPKSLIDFIFRFVRSTKMAEKVGSQIQDEGLSSDYSSHDEVASEYTVAEQRAILRKVDKRLVVLVGFMYCVSLMDRSNLSNAKIAGELRHITFAV